MSIPFPEITLLVYYDHAVKHVNLYQEVLEFGSEGKIEMEGGRAKLIIKQIVDILVQYY